MSNLLPTGPSFPEGNALPTGTALPIGTVTFLFTDIVGSMPLWEEWSDLMVRSLVAKTTR